MLLHAFVLLALPVLAVSQNPSRCTVRPRGGGQDDGPNINAAFETCSNNSVITLDGYYAVDTLLFTSNLSNVDIELSGTVQYTPDIAKWTQQSYFLAYQNATTFWFLSGTNIHLFGGGTLDGNGQVWWDTFNISQNAGTAGGSSRTFARPIPLTVGNSTNVIVENITQIGSPFWNNFVYQSSNVTYMNINISTVSLSSSPTANSDGWDIYRSSFVTVTNSTVNNDDDCVSFKPNSTNILVSNMNCNGSHGISVGSLGQYAGETDIVANVTVANITMSNAQNGARIKVFGGSPFANSTAGGGTGFVNNVTFENFHVSNVDNPVLINQCYSTPTSVCAQYPSNLTISNVHYINVTGSSSGSEKSVVVDLECSTNCANITASGTNLTAPGGTSSYICKNIVSLSSLDFNCTSPSSDAPSGSGPPGPSSNAPPSFACPGVATFSWVILSIIVTLNA